jgi:uncharacterized membrane protein
MEFIYFLGRFHVAVLHIPLGVIVALFVLELLSRREKYRHFASASAYLWVVGAVSAIVTAVMGYMHFAEGSFDSASGIQHRTFGTILAVAITLVAGLRVSNAAERFASWFLPASIVMVVLATVTGHYGGNLTHGSTYLVEHGPQFLRSMAGLGPRRPPVESLEAADPFLDLVGPMLTQRCSRCHSDDTREADLNLTSHAGIMRGGESGPVVSRARPQASELLNRITLPRDDEAFMPAEGNTPLTEAQVRIIEWWLTAGAPVDTVIGELDSQPDPATATLIRVELGLSGG